MAIAAAGVPAVAQAASSGGMTYAPEPKLAKVRCVRDCGPRRRIQGGSAVRISGRNLDAVTTVVFMGARTAADDKPARVRAQGARSLLVPVPFDAQTGPVQAVASGGIESEPTAAIRILPPPPPAKQSELSPATGPRDAGAPLLETATSSGKWFYGGQRGILFSYRLSAPADVEVSLVRLSDGAVVQSWSAPGVAAGDLRTLRWTGVSGGELQPEGRYAFRLVARTGGAQVTNSPVGDSTRDAFDFYQHVFPVRGRHEYGEAGARFGAARPGRSHQGQDVLARCGLRVVAAQGGTVKYTAYQAAAGYYMVIRGLDGQDYAYMHLAGPTPFTEGDKVYTGQQIGVVGDTGNASACDLHFEIWTKPGWYDGGRPIDPLPPLQAWDRVS